MTNKEKVVWFCIKKDALLFKETGIHLFTEEDIADIKEHITEEQCVHFIKHLRLTLHHFGKCQDGSTCIWCVTLQGCARCHYKERHGTDMALTPKPGMLQLLSTYNKARKVAESNGLFLGPRCAPCQNNTISMPWDSPDYLQDKKIAMMRV